MSYVIEATLSFRGHPEHGTVTVPFPIPRDEYDRTIELLEGIDIGDPLRQDCQVVGLDSSYSILNRLVMQSVNMDELDYLAKRLDSFCNGEDAKFQAMAHKLGISGIKDFINLTFSCQQTTVITDFSDLEQIGKNHTLHTNGGAMASAEYDELDGEAIARYLIESGKGEVTPYGVVFDNGMKLEQVYDGQHFPLYLYESPLLNLEVRSGHPDSPAEFLPLPASDKQIERTLLRAGVTDVDSAVWDVESGELSEPVALAIKLENEDILSLNKLCRAIKPLDTAQREKLNAVVLMAKPRSAGEVRQLAENLDQFEFAPDVQTLEDYGRYMIQESGHFEYDENLEGFYDYHHFGEIRSREDGGEFTDLGYVSYHGTLTLDELMQEDPMEQQEEPEIGPVMM